MNFGKQLAKKRRFSGAAGPCYNHRREMPGGLSDHIIQVSRYIEICIAFEYYEILL